MPGNIESSIIIPVYNQWKFTCDCLAALKKTLGDRPCEIIIVDNGSEDETGIACPALGARLFGEFFHYKRFDNNLNFGPASNYGASIAKGDYLVFLNNDTVPLEGWYEPLLDDFSKFPDIAATGPLLVYPERAPFGHQVQHLGVFVTPTLSAGHLYEGIPANSPLARKRRFFQIITAACMMIRRSLFNEFGRFDERFINGFEDVDLCARLWNAGYRMTVNPEARVVHYTSQTPGRNKYETESSRLLNLGNQRLLTPDWHIHLEKDGLALRLSPWQTIQGSLPAKDLEKLDIVARQASIEELQNALLRYPLWREGFLALIDRLHRQDMPIHDLCMTACKLWPEPRVLFAAYQYALAEHDAGRLDFCMELLLDFCKNFEEYVEDAHAMATWAKDIGLHDLEREYHNWLANRENFYTDYYAPFLKRMLEKTQDIPFHANCEWAYALWRNNLRLPDLCPGHAGVLRTHEGEIAFSILMPVYNPKPEYLVQAIDSILAQEYPHWELCLAEDASTAPGTRGLIETIAAKDSRIRVTFREKNGHIAAATNTALAMAEKRYAALMDQDDLITPDALKVMARYITENPEAVLFFSDEDKVTDGGKFFYPHFKNGKWDWELFHGQNFVNHLGVYRTDKLREIGGFRDGFAGAQDYDMLLRYTRDITTDKIVHIPQILYHWRAHADSTATDVSVKSEAVESSRLALQEKMTEEYPGSVVARMPGHQLLRVQYPLPARRPFVSLVLDIGTELQLAKAQIEELTAKTNYDKLELLVLYNEDAPQQHIHWFVRWAETERQLVLLPYNGQPAPAQRHNIALQKAGGSVVGFLAKGVIPLTQNWLEHILGLLCRNNVGAATGKLVCTDNTILHGGYLADATGKLGPAFSGLPKNSPGYFAWNRLVRTVDAVDAFCFFTHRRLLQSTGNFDLSLPDTAIQDYCLRIARDGFRSVWTPFVEFLITLPAEPPRVGNGYIEDSRFCARWGGKIQACNPGLTLTAGGWALNKKMLENTSGNSRRAALAVATKTSEPSPGPKEKASGLVDEKFYYETYPDVKESGMPADAHFLNYGWLEGRNPNPHFDTAFYLKQYPGLRDNPLEHYVAKGKAEGALYKKPEILFHNYDGTRQKLCEAALPDNGIRPVAWYLPQFHPIAENDIAWGNGFTEWANVAAAKPIFCGHKQPKLPGALGFYDLRNKETLIEQINLAKHAGIYGFCLHHYWFSGHKVLRAPLEHWKNDSSLDFPFCLHWANEAWTKRWDGGSQDVIIPQHYSPADDLLFIDDIAWALRDKRYMRFQGKPMLGVYRPDLLPDITATIQRWRDYCARESIGDIFLFANVSFCNTKDKIAAYGFDCCVEYPPHGSPIPQIDKTRENMNYFGALRSYHSLRDTFLVQSAEPYPTPCFRGVMPGWDNSARSDTGAIFVGSSPDLYREWLEATIRLAQNDVYQGEKYLFINAWNEWAESAYLEPDAEYGYATLNATVSAVTQTKKLPKMLFVCDIGKKGQANWLEKILLANRQNPQVDPVVFAAKPVQSAGSFKGLAPLVTTFATTGSDSVKRLFATHGCMTFHATVMLSELPYGQIKAVAAISEHVIVHDTAKAVLKSIPCDGCLWTTADCGDDLANWQLTRIGTGKTQRLTSMFSENRQEKDSQIEISVLVIPDQRGALHVREVARAVSRSPFRMEIIIPDAATGNLPEELHFGRAKWGDMQTYVSDGILRAHGKYIWFFFPSGASVAPDLPALMRAAFVDEDIVSVRSYTDTAQDVLPHIFGRDTVKLSGADIVDAANCKSLNLHPESLFALYRRASLVKALADAGGSEVSFIERLVEQTYLRGNVGVMPWSSSEDPKVHH